MLQISTLTRIAAYHQYRHWPVFVQMRSLRLQVLALFHSCLRWAARPGVLTPCQWSLEVTADEDEGAGTVDINSIVFLFLNFRRQSNRWRPNWSEQHNHNNRKFSSPVNGAKNRNFLNRTTIYLESKWVTVIWFLITGPRFRIGWILRWRSNQNTAVGKSSFEAKIVCVYLFMSSTKPF